MNIIFVILSILTFCYSAVFAQDTLSNKSDVRAIASKKLHVAYGAAYNLKLDRTYSRLAKHGFNHLVYLGYGHVNTRRMMNVQGDFMIGALRTKENSITFIHNYAVNLKFRYLKRIQKISADNFSIYVGGNMNFRGEIWFPEQSLRYGWDINLGVGFAGAIYYKINPRLSFWYHLDLSLLGILWRSHNNGQQLTTEEIQLEKGLVAAVFETPRFSHLLNTVYIDNSFQLFYTASQKIDIYYHFGVSYRYIQKPLIKKGYEFNNAIGVAFKF